MLLAMNGMMWFAGDRKQVGLEKLIGYNEKKTLETIVDDTASF